MSKGSMRHALLLIILLGTQIINVHAWEIDQISSVTKIVDGDSFKITSDEVRLADIMHLNGTSQEAPKQPSL
jgi:endonuclease YncB( thermonuclease family)